MKQSIGYFPAKYEQGRRDAIKQTVDARTARDNPSFHYRDGWRAGAIERILNPNVLRRTACSEPKSVNS